MSATTGKRGIGINGLGRIGKLVLQISEGREGCPVQVVAINDPFMSCGDIVYAIKYDSVHGRFAGTVVEGDDGESVVINGRRVAVGSSKEPAACNWAAHGASIVVDCSGQFTSLAGASEHLKGGAERVVVSAPSKDIPMFVLGVNGDELTADDHVVSNASCTTNCLAPLVKVVHDAFGIEEAVATTVHAATGSQRIVDLNNKKNHRLGRSGMLNIIPSTTGAAAAVAKVFPALDGRITGMAMRVPTADVSVVDVTIKLASPASLDDIHAAMTAAAAGDMAGILGVTADAVVSTDFVGSTYSCVYDADASLALSDTFVKLIGWYDNEYSYTARLVDLIERVVALA
ncbi:glyceraldehyde-3-phosphate dehydrogenase 1 [Thecamonas trahens ATCC 50062]|uniref:Glyceraldehyde-3-phosphate dehydrogenase n=1 Tax=Thecamonas trahens ATCC 50062 TaxID=461836 RepID=A0A0L0DJ11_THETB|nr:glyceraldehyde-3-phosphate dehydrogenase 1 [Thecamonas trahens ATCC 50062]KNC51318.1 glyceraldehyde-3-phosphate dehydrogenase 1 [Thecamonas trahens ATCC 50062]|eukprot:XP_013756240.1 glyceraldehyde-3-phosphate dehydrogenase 1 [Thecamonas trahens ATCC 50062]